MMHDHYLLLISTLTAHVIGFGTVDSGHLCLSGYSEVVLLRRLPKGHDRNAMINALGGDVFETPHHIEEEVRIPPRLHHCPTLKSTFVSCCVQHHREE
jgi:hypothetical protein